MQTFFESYLLCPFSVLYMILSGKHFSRWPITKCKLLILLNGTETSFGCALISIITVTCVRQSILGRVGKTPSREEGGFEKTQTYQTHCDICPMSHQVASTSGKIELKTRYFLQNIAFPSQSRRSITNAPPVLNKVLSKLLVVKNLGYFVKISMGHFYIFFRRFGCKFTKGWPVFKAAGRENCLDKACSE